MTENKVLMQQAREALKGKWDNAVLAYLVYFLITGAASSLQGYASAAPALSLLVAGPMMYGMVVYCLAVSRGGSPELSKIFDGFKRYATTLATHLLMALFVMLWSLLLIVPGIIAAISYSQAFYILAEDESVSPMDALKKSRRMMDGYKWSYFCLCLRFTGWFFLALLTLGIGFLWLAPYMQVSFAKFYDDLKSVRNAQA